MKNVILYCRVNTVINKDGLEGQETALREFCKRNKLNVVVCVHEICSANLMDKPQLTQVYNLCKDGVVHIDHILCTTLSRLTRDGIMGIEYMQRFKNVGTEIATIEGAKYENLFFAFGGYENN